MLLSTAAVTVTTVTVISSSPSPNNARMLSIRVLFLRNIINDDVANFVTTATNETDSESFQSPS